MGLMLKWPDLQVHLPTISDWQLGSTYGASGSFEVLGEGPSVNAGFINIPIKRVVNGRIVETAVLKGPGVGVGISTGLQMPFVNVSGSTASTFGLGSALVLGPMSPRPMKAKDFEGACVVGTALGQVFQAQAASLIMFVPEAYLMLGPLAAAMIKAAGVTYGVQGASAIAQAGADVLAYRVKL